MCVKKSLNILTKGKIRSIPAFLASLCIGSEKIDPIIKCKSDINEDKKITENICKYIIKFFFLSFKINARGTKKINAKISWISELFSPIKNKKK